MITVCFQFLTIVMSGIFGIILGYKTNNYKTLKSIIYGIIIYILLSLLSLGILYVTGLINPEFMNIFKSIIINSNTLKNMMFIIVSIYALYNISMYIIGNKLLNEGVNVD